MDNDEKEFKMFEFMDAFDSTFKQDCQLFEVSHLNEQTGY